MILITLAAFGWSSVIVLIIYSQRIIKQANQYLNFYGEQLKSAVSINKEALESIEIQQQVIDELNARIEEYKNGN